MNQETRSNIYAFLSRTFADILDYDAIRDLKRTPDLLDLIGKETRTLFDKENIENLQDLLNIDFTSLFVISTHPVEQAVVDNSTDIPIGLENPVMQFYFNHGFEVNLNQTHIMAPDHLAVELGFMHKLVEEDNGPAQKAFLAQHLLSWVPPYLLGCATMATTPFYRDICDFAAEFLISDYDGLMQEADHG